MISLDFQKNGHLCNTQRMQSPHHNLQIPTIAIHPPSPKVKHIPDLKKHGTIPNSLVPIEHQSKSKLKREHAMIWPDEYQRAHTSKRQKTGLVPGNTDLDWTLKDTICGMWSNMSGKMVATLPQFDPQFLSPPSSAKMRQPSKLQPRYKVTPPPSYTSSHGGLIPVTRHQIGLLCLSTLRLAPPPRE